MDNVKQKENTIAEKEVKQKNAKSSKASKTIQKIKSIKNIEIIVAVIAVILMLVIYFSSKIKINNTASANSNEDTSATISNYCEKMESELTDLLTNMKGAGNSKVIINWENSVETIIAYITNTGSNSTTSTPSIIQSNGVSKPIILKEIYPKALGVVIICQGGDIVSVKLDIINAVSVLLDLTPDKICVYSMKQ